MMIAWVFPVGRSGCMDASTTKRLSVPQTLVLVSTTPVPSFVADIWAVPTKWSPVMYDEIRDAPVAVLSL